MISFCAYKARKLFLFFVIPMTSADLHLAILCDKNVQKKLAVNTTDKTEKAQEGKRGVRVHFTKYEMECFIYFSLTTTRKGIF